MKLLNYSARRYLLLSSLLILLSIPAFYIVVNALFIKSVDESLELEASYLPQYLAHIHSQKNLEFWKKIDLDLKIEKLNRQNFNPEAFNTESYNKISKETEQYRNLQRKVSLFKQQYVITFRTSLVEKDDLLQSILLVQISLLLFLFIGSSLINRSISKKIWQPFKNILLFLKKFELDQNITLDKSHIKIDEFNELNNEINQLVIRTQKTYLLQKEFTENAAHELQTPIAVIKSKIELFYQDQSLTKNQSVLVNEINKNLNKLNELNKNLLLLAKIENQQFPFTEDIRLKEIIEEILEDLAFFAEAKHQNFKKEVFENSNHTGNAVLIAQLLKNLLINAIQYTPQGKNIVIHLNQNQLIIKNEGVILGFNEDQLFRRFNKLQQSNSTGNGLGLAICKKIADAHHFKLNYVYAQNEHHFILKF